MLFRTNKKENYLKIDWKNYGTMKKLELRLKREIIHIIIRMMAYKINMFYTEKNEEKEEVFIDPNKFSDDGTISLAGT